MGRCEWSGEIKRHLIRCKDCQKKVGFHLSYQGLCPGCVRIERIEEYML